VEHVDGARLQVRRAERTDDSSARVGLDQHVDAASGLGWSRSYNAVDRRTLEGGLNDILDQLEKSKLYQASGYQSWIELYPPLLLLASLLLLIEVALSATRLRSFP
jgi:hypothetical protein